MEIIKLYHLARDSEKGAEENLFQQLTVRFRYIVNSKVRNQQDTEEIVQSALLVILKEYKTLNADHHFEPWAYKVLSNRVLSYMKSRRRHDARIAGLDDMEQVLSDNKSDDHLKAKLRECLEKIRKKNQTYSRILSLHFQGYKTNEICEKLNMTPNNFYVTLSRARALLSKCLEGEDT